MLGFELGTVLPAQAKCCQARGANSSEDPPDRRYTDGVWSYCNLDCVLSPPLKYSSDTRGWSQTICDTFQSLPPFLQMSWAHTGRAVVSSVCHTGGDSVLFNMLYWHKLHFKSDSSLSAYAHNAWETGRKQFSLLFCDLLPIVLLRLLSLILSSPHLFLCAPTLLPLLCSCLVSLSLPLL